MKNLLFILPKIRKIAVFLICILFFGIQQSFGQNNTNSNNNSWQTKSTLDDTISVEKAMVVTKIQVVSAERQNVAVAVPAEKRIVSVSKTVTDVDVQKVLVIKSDTISRNNELIAIPEEQVKTKVVVE